MRMQAEPFLLRGKTALITGAAKRLAKTCAVSLAENGANIIVHYNHSERDAVELVDIIRSKGVDAWPLQAEFSDPDRAGDAFDRAVQLAGDISVLINSASIFEPDRITDFSADELTRAIHINAMTPLVLSRKFARHVGESGRRGRIVNFLDSRYLTGDPIYAAYHISKRVLFTMTRMTAQEFAPTVSVNAVAPGLILPPPGEDDAYLEARSGKNPMHARGTPTMVAEAVVFLIRSAFITGQVLFVDGGAHLNGNLYG